MTLFTDVMPENDAVHVFGVHVQQLYPSMTSDTAAFIGRDIASRVPRWLRTIKFWETGKYPDLVHHATVEYLRHFVRDVADNKSSRTGKASQQALTEVHQLFSEDIAFLRRRKSSRR